MKNPNKIFLQGTTKIENKYAILLYGLIRKFRSSFINDLTANGKTVAVANLTSTSIFTDLSPLLQSIYRTAGLFGARLSFKEIKGRAGLKNASLGRNEQWIRDVQDFLRMHLLKFVSNITQTMRDDILKILEQGVENGWSIDETVKALEATGLMQARARVIARTETIRAANVGHSVAAQSLPYEVDKKWNAARDHRTRHSHRAVAGHTVSEDGLFKVAIYKKGVIVGYDEMQYPGDATAHPSNTINCRCRVTYLPKRDAQGRLVMRKPNAAQIIPLRNPSTSIPAHQIAATLKANIFIGPKLDEDETK